MIFHRIPPLNVFKCTNRSNYRVFLLNDKKPTFSEVFLCYSLSQLSSNFKTVLTKKHPFDMKHQEMPIKFEFQKFLLNKNLT